MRGLRTGKLMFGYEKILAAYFSVDEGLNQSVKIAVGHNV
jgi:hypothetical protein